LSGLHPEATIKDDGEVQARFVKTHVGHELDEGRLRLPMKIILDEVRVSLYQSELKREIDNV
jgi:hypothetical protein